MPFIAELGVNHLGNFDRAVEMVDKAIEEDLTFLSFKLIMLQIDMKNQILNMKNLPNY